MKQASVSSIYTHYVHSISNYMIYHIDVNSVVFLLQLPV